MPDKVLVKPGAICVDTVVKAVGRVVFESPARIEAFSPPCGWPKMCGRKSCRFPRYFHGAPYGVVGNTLIKLGFPSTLLKDLDTEYQLGEVLHPGVKISRSRNEALGRIDDKGVALLTWLQSQAKHELTWAQLHVKAFRPRKGLRVFDRKDRPWLY